MSLDKDAIRESVYARLDAERPWHVLTFFEVGIIVSVRAKTLGDALGRLGRRWTLRRERWLSMSPPGRYTWRTEPYERVTPT